MVYQIPIDELETILKLWKFAKASYYPRSRQWDTDRLGKYLPGFRVGIASKSHMTAILAESDSEFVVAYSGTDDLKDAWANIKAVLPSPYPHDTSSSYVGRGFHEGYQINASTIVAACEQAHERGLNISVTGHSAGAAYATILADQLLRVGISCSNVILFESPRVLSADLAKSFTAILKDSRVIRVTHGADPVPHLPTFFRFRHVGDEVWIPRKYGLNAVLNPNWFRRAWAFIKTSSFFKCIEDHTVAAISPRLKWELAKRKGDLDNG